MPETEAQGGERILASPTEACACKTFLAYFPYWTNVDFRILPELVHFTCSSEKDTAWFRLSIAHTLFDLGLKKKMQNMSQLTDHSGSHSSLPTSRSASSLAKTLSRHDL